ncbi:MAG: cytochrome C oxidase subunit IV family protein [Pseudorhodobacter sp.]
MDILTRTWLILIALTAGTVAVANFDGRLAAAGLLILAWFKARTILGGFLHLSAAPGWLGAMAGPLGFWLVVLWGVAAVALR